MLQIEDSVKFLSFIWPDIWDVHTSPGAVVILKHL